MGDIGGRKDNYQESTYYLKSKIERGVTCSNILKNIFGVPQLKKKRLQI